MAEETEHRHTYKPYVDTNSLVGVMQAIEKQDYSDIKAQLQKGRDPNVGNMSGSVPLELAAWKGDQELINILLAAGADKSKVKVEDYYAITTIKKA